MIIDVPEGKDPINYVWGEMVPGIGGAAATMALKVYSDSTLGLREFEAARLRIAQINGCLFCQDWRTERDGEKVEDTFDEAVTQLAHHGRVRRTYAPGCRVRRAVRDRPPQHRRRCSGSGCSPSTTSARSSSSACASARGCRSVASTGSSDSTPPASCRRTSYDDARRRLVDRHARPSRDRRHRPQSRARARRRLGQQPRQGRQGRRSARRASAATSASSPSTDRDTVLAAKPDCIVYCAITEDRFFEAFEDLVGFLEAGINVVASGPVILLYPEPDASRLDVGAHRGGRQEGQRQPARQRHRPGLGQRHLSAAAHLAEPAHRPGAGARDRRLLDVRPGRHDGRHLRLRQAHRRGGAALAARACSRPGGVPWCARWLPDSASPSTSRWSRSSSDCPPRADMSTVCVDIKKGTMAAVRFEVIGMVDGEPRIVVEHVTRTHRRPGARLAQARQRRRVLPDRDHRRADDDGRLHPHRRAR